MSNPDKRPWRKNVLTLVASGYGTILIVFLSLAFSSTLSAEQAYDAVQGPLMALIGGSLAIAKDLLQLDREETSTPDDNRQGAGAGSLAAGVTAVGTLQAHKLHVGKDVQVSVAGAFQNALTYQASSSAPSIATVSVSGAQVTVTSVAEGVGTITVTASGAGNSVATQQFEVTVLPTA